jgi:hypothetical protein
VNIFQIIKDQYVFSIISIIAGGIGGIIVSLVTQKILSKRGLFSYFVNHLRVGITTEDKIFGSVAVTWNNNPMPNLFLSTIELTNESLNDYEKIIIHTHSNTTKILSEYTQLLGTPNILEWSKSYKNRVFVEPGETPTKNQKDIYFSQREYIIPVFNRGQKIRITFLNSAKGPKVPTIWVSVLEKGVKLKYKLPKRSIFGVPQPNAAIAGLFMGIVVIIFLGLFIKSNWIAIIIALIYGLIAQLPGAYIIKFLRKIREAIGG